MISNNGNQALPSTRANGHFANSDMKTDARPVANALRQLPKSASVDWLGAVIRRKGLVIFTVVVATILGYLVYLKQPKVYASQLKLIVWTQQPPRSIDNEVLVQPSATGKYIQLLSSHMVMEEAANRSELSRLATFSGNRAPQYALKGMISVAPVEDAVDTLLVTAKGPRPEDLPEILTAVVSAFEKNLLADSARFSDEVAEVFKSFQDKLAEDKSNTESRFRELIQKLGISPDPVTRKFVSPYGAEIQDLKSIKNGYERELREIKERINNMREISTHPPSVREESLRVLALEAAKYLQIATSSTPSDGEQNARLAKTQGKIEILENRVNELKFEESRVRRNVGNKHPAALSVLDKLNFYSSQLSTQLQLLERIKNESLKESSNSEVTSIYSGADPSITKTIDFYAASLDRNAKRLQNSIDSLDVDLDELEKNEVALRGDIEELNMLAERTRATDADLHQTLEKLSTLTLLSSNYETTKVRVIDPPGVGYQVEPTLFKVLSLFVFAGFGIGVGLVMLLDWSDLSYRNPEEIKERLGLPVVARISKITHTGNFREGHAETLVTVSKPHSPVSEAYRACRTAMLFMAKQQNMKTFLVTSPAAGDGKSTTSLNLAMCFAQGGLKTIIVDADLRRPRCHAYLGVQPSPGLKDYSLGDANAQQIVRQTELHPNLSVVTAGRHFANPSQFIDSLQFEQFLEELREQFDIIIIDSPPVLPVADSLALASRCDGVLLVMKIRKGVVLSSQKACESLRSVNANLLGVIVNQVERMSHYSDYGKYGYNGYGGYAYYAGRYYGKQNDKYYETEKSGADEDKG